MEDHKKLVDSLIKQGAKFRNTMKYGFPIQARKTIQNQLSENESINAKIKTINSSRMN